MFRPSSRLAGAPIPVKIAERRRQILVVTPFSAPPAGPVEQVAGHLIAEISGGHNFTLQRAVPEYSPQQLANALRRAVAPFSRALRAWREMRANVHDADMVWLHDAGSLASVMAFRMARKLNKPVFITQHRGPADRTGMAKRVTGYLADRLFTESMLEAAKQTSFTSDAAADHYYRRVAFTAPVKIIPNGADLNVFRAVSPETRRALRARFALRDNQPILLYAGPFDGPDLPVIRFLAQKLPEWRFWLVGDGAVDPSGWFLPNLQVFPKRDAGGRAELYQAADLFLLPHNGSAFPLAAQEAMACGVPVMCSPTLAGGSDQARPYLWTVEVFDGDPRATASLWSHKLRLGRPLLPLTEPKTELSELARSFWEWPQIAGHYADILRGICKTERKTAA